MPIDLRWQKGNVVCGREADNIQTGQKLRNPLLFLEVTIAHNLSLKNQLQGKSNVRVQSVFYLDSFRPNI